MDVLVDWSADLCAAAVACAEDFSLEALAQACASDRARLGTRLLEVMRRPIVREALRSASPSLLAAFEEDAEADSSQLSWRVMRSLVRFLGRLAGRPESFGTLAGWSIGRVGAVNDLAIGGPETYRRCASVSQELLVLLSREMRAGCVRREGTRYFRRAGLYRAGNSWRFWGTPTLDRPSSLARFPCSAPLDAVLERCIGGATVQDLASHLSASTDVAADEVRVFVDQLVEEGLLVLEPSVTGEDDDIHRMTTALADSSGEMLDETLRTAYAAATGVVLALNGTPLGTSAASTTPVEAVVRVLGDAPAVQTALVKPSARLGLSETIVGDLCSATSMLASFIPDGSRPALETFCRRFRDRYGDRDAPLGEALDPDVGIGFGRSVSLYPESGPYAEPVPGRLTPLDTDRPYDARYELLSGLVLRATRSGHREVVLGDADALPGRRPAASADTAVVSAVLLARSERDLDAGEFRLRIKNVSAAPAARMLSRLACHDESLRQYCEAVVALEEERAGDAVLAEVCYSPPTWASLYRRARLYRYRIVFGDEVAEADPSRIPLADLWVRVRDSRVVLHSSRLGRRVIPRVSSPVRLDAKHPVVLRFLAAVQQGVLGGAAWHWGPLASAAFLPRVRKGRVIMSPASWAFTPSELGSSLSPATSTEAFLAVQRWRNRWDVPRWVSGVDASAGRTELPVDLDNVLSVASLCDMASRAGASVRLAEMLPAPEECCIRSPEGRFVHDLLIPVAFSSSRGLEEPPESARSWRPLSWHVRRSGGRWVYLKMYCSPSEAESWLVSSIAPHICRLFAAGRIDRWFVVRYADPERHIRLRLRASSRRFAEEVLASTRDLVGGEGRGPVVEWASYDPEVVRYGGPRALHVCERIFQQDSEAVLEWLSREDAGDPRRRWAAGLESIDAFLRDFNLTLPKRIALLSARLAAFDDRLRGEMALRRWVQRNRRRERAAVSLALEPVFDDARAPFRGRSTRVVPLAHELKRLSERGLLITPIQAIVGSLLHMGLNRLFRGLDDAHEEILLDLVREHYRRELHRTGR